MMPSPPPEGEPDVPNVPFSRPESFTDEQILAALKAAKGKVYLAAKRIGCSHVTIYRRLYESSEMREVRAEARGEFVDIAETKLREAVMAGKAWAILRVLKTIGRDRGYGNAEPAQENTAGR